MPIRGELWRTMTNVGGRSQEALKTTKVQAFGGSNPSPSANPFLGGASPDRLNTKAGPKGRFSAFLRRWQTHAEGAERRGKVSSKSQKPLGFSQTTGVAKSTRPPERPLGLLPVGGPKGLPGRPRTVPEKLLRPVVIAEAVEHAMCWHVAEVSGIIEEAMTGKEVSYPTAVPVVRKVAEASPQSSFHGRKRKAPRGKG